MTFLFYKGVKMIDFLIRFFIKGYKEYKETKVREKYGLLAAILGITSNLFLVMVKITIGFISNSLAIVADGFNNLSDMISSIISLISFKVAGKSADRDHPFGHGRMEYIAALLVAFFVVIVGYEITKEAIFSILNPRDLTFNPLITAILIFSVLVKVWQMFMYKKFGKKIDSDTLLATAIDSRNDIIVTTGTIISILVLFFFKVNIDGIVSLLIGLFILYSGFGLGKDVVSTLLGQSLSREEADKIKHETLQYEGILGVHDIISHTYGPSYSMVSLHAEVSDRVPISVSHELIDIIEYEVGEKLGIFLVIHMDPISIDDPRLNILKAKVQALLKTKEKDFSSHDFRLVKGENSLNFIFDLEIPYDFKEEEQEELEKEILREIKNIDSRYKVIINMETSFVE